MSSEIDTSIKMSQISFNYMINMFMLQGAIQGPEEFAEGLALGVRSLLGHAVGRHTRRF